MCGSNNSGICFHYQLVNNVWNNITCVEWPSLFYSGLYYVAVWDEKFSHRHCQLKVYIHAVVDCMAKHAEYTKYHLILNVNPTSFPSRSLLLSYP